MANKEKDDYLTTAAKTYFGTYAMVGIVFLTLFFIIFIRDFGSANGFMKYLPVVAIPVLFTMACMKRFNTMFRIACVVGIFAVTLIGKQFI